MIGIYGIRNQINGKIYVGQSVNISTRQSEHLCDLRKGEHYNKHLQKSFNKYGEDQFEFLTLEECDAGDLPLKEQEWINKYNRRSLYNQLFEVQNHQGAGNPFFGKTHTEESKIKMSEWKKENYQGRNNPNYGKKNNKDALIKMSEGRSNKLKKSDVIEIVKLLKEDRPHKEIADLFQVGRTVITKISNGTRWTNVTGGPVFPVIYKDGIRQFSKSHRQRIGDKRKGQKHTEESKQLMGKKAKQRR